MSDLTMKDGPMSLSNLLSRLSHIPGSGHKAVFQWGGKQLTVDKIVQETVFDKNGDPQIETRIVLKEVK